MMGDNQDVGGIIEDVAPRRKKPTWGGARPGAGRRSEVEEPVQFTLQLEKAEMDRLRDIAEKRGVPVARVVREALRAHLRRRGKS